MQNIAYLKRLICPLRGLMFFFCKYQYKGIFSAKNLFNRTNWYFKISIIHGQNGEILNFISIEHFCLFAIKYVSNCANWWKFSRVSMKWLNFSRKIFFANFCAWNAMSFALFFLCNLRKTVNIFCESCAWNEIFVLGNFFAQFAQNRKFYAKCNFLGKLSKIDIISLELNNWRFIPYIKKKYWHMSMITIILYTQLVTSSYKKFKLRDQNS